MEKTLKKKQKNKKSEGSLARFKKIKEDFNQKTKLRDESTIINK